MDDDRLLFKTGDFCARIDCKLFLVEEVLKLFACVFNRVSLSLLKAVFAGRHIAALPVACEGECSSMNTDPVANVPLVFVLPTPFPRPIVVILKVLQLRWAMPKAPAPSAFDDPAAGLLLV